MTLFKFHFPVFAVLALTVCASVHAAAPDNKAAAREHFERGVAAFSDRRFGDAANEFNTAYQISPAFALLYNIGQVNVALGNPVEAVDAFEKYLAQAGATVSESRRKEVIAELENQRGRIGTMALTAQPEGADVRLDGKSIGKAPLHEPIRLSAGRHSITVLAEGYTAQVREFDIAPRAQLELEMKLNSAQTGDASATAATVAVSPTIAATSNSTPIAQSTPVQPPREPRVTSAAPERPANGDTGAVQRGLGYATGAVGIALIASGGVLAIVSSSQANTAQTRMTSASDQHDAHTWDLANSDYNSAQSRNHLGLEGIGIGAALFIGGGLLVLTAPSPRSSTAWTLAPFKTAQASGIAARVAW